MREAFEKAGYKGGGGGKKCKCGETINDPKYDTCFKCGQEQKGKGDGGSLPHDYLSKGYFDARGCLHEKLLTEEAKDIAEKLSKARPELKNHQLRRFYQHVKAVDNRLRMTKDWGCCNPDLKRLKSFVAEAKGKRKVPDLFYEFITKNLDKVTDEKSFAHGFMEHFQAVVGFFTFYKPKD